MKKKQFEIIDAAHPIFYIDVYNNQIVSLSQSVIDFFPSLAVEGASFTQICQLYDLAIDMTVPACLREGFPDFIDAIEPYTCANNTVSTTVTWSFLPAPIDENVFILVASQSVLVSEHIQAANEQISQMRFVLDRVPYFLFWKDKNSIFLGCNQLFAETASLEKSSDIIGKSDFELPWSDEESYAYIADDQEVMQSRQSKLNIEETQTLNGQEITLLTSKVPLFNEQGEIGGILGIYTDITKLKNTQKELEEQKRIAESANMAKSNFLATISHELRTPLNGILGTVQVLASRPDIAGYVDQLNDIQLAAETLESLLNDVLDFTSMEQGRLSLKLVPFVIGDVTQQVIRELSFAAQKKDLDLNFETDMDPNITFIGDPLRIRQVVTNLLNNAVKFTKSGSVSLVVDYVTTPDSRLIFSITDTGIGMTPDQQKIVFERFVQVESNYDRRFEGVGLGLAICKELVETMGGEITVTSELRNGSCFKFYVPVTEVTHQMPVNEMAFDPNAIAGRILLVEDNPLNRRVFQMMLDEFPLHVDVAENGYQALSLVDQHSYDLIFLDISLPDMDGITIAKKIRETSVREVLPIIAVTAHAFESDKTACLEAGMNDIIIKPINMQILHHILVNYLTSASSD